MSRLPTWRVLAVTAMILFCVAAVVGLTFAGKNTADVVYLLVAVLPPTTASILSVKQGNENAARLANVQEQTNGPISNLTRQVGDLHEALKSVAPPADK